MQSWKRAMPTRRDVLAASAAALACAQTSFLSRAFAQAIKKPVRVIVGFPAGGGTDAIARILADRLRGPYASTVLVENKPGAAARIAVEYVKNAEPDGSVMLFTPDFPLTVYPHSFRSLNYDPLRDFTAVSPAAKSMLTYNVGPAVPENVKTLAEFVQWCKANPAKAVYGTTAAGGTPHFVGMMLANAAGVAMTPVHYRGGAPALTALLGGHIDALFISLGQLAQPWQAGQVRALAVGSRTRVAEFPQLPTVAESGLPEFEASSWFGLVAPSGTSSEIVVKINADVQRILSDASFKEKFLVPNRYEPIFGSAEEFGAFMKTDTRKWTRVIRDANVKVD
jgi:tripartite-type tricarboxylate transporter receptor subunit TctC